MSPVRSWTAVGSAVQIVADRVSHFRRKRFLLVGFGVAFSPYIQDRLPVLRYKVFYICAADFDCAKTGVHGQQIHCVKTLSLFAVQLQEDGKKAADIASDSIMRKWWDYMADIMETNPDNSPVTVGLQKVFHLD